MKKKPKYELFLVELENYYMSKKPWVFGENLNFMIKEHFPEKTINARFFNTYKIGKGEDLDIKPFNKMDSYDLDINRNYDVIVSNGLYPRYIYNLLESGCIIFNRKIDRCFLYAYNMRKSGNKDIRYKIFVNMFYGIISSKKQYVEFIYDEIDFEYFGLNAQYKRDINVLKSKYKIVYPNTDMFLIEHTEDEKTEIPHFEFSIKNKKYNSKEVLDEFGYVRNTSKLLRNINKNK